MIKKKNILIYIKRYEIIIASMAVILLVVFLVINMLIPNIKHANEIYDQRESVKKKLSNLKAKDTKLSVLDYQSFKNLFIKLNQVIPESKDYVSLISTFNLLEGQSGVSITRTNFELGVVSNTSKNLVRADGTPAYVIPISVEIQGNLDAVKKFLDLVSEYNGRLMVFDDMSVNIKNSGIFEVRFTGQAFFYPLPQTLSPVDAPLPILTKTQEAIMKKIDKLALVPESASDLDKDSIGKKNLFQ